MTVRVVALGATGVTFSYDGRVPVLVDVTFEVSPGSLFAVLGPNGSGKSTLFQLILGLLKPRSGELTLFGSPVGEPATRRSVGWVSSDLSQSLLLTVDEYFALLQSTQPDFDVDFARELLAPFQITEARSRLLGALSHGMRKKVQLIGALAHRPRLLLLDEPFSGLDPHSHSILAAALVQSCELGATVVFASHELEVVDRLATDVAILFEGSLKASGPPEDLYRAANVGSLRDLYLVATEAAEQAQRSADDLARLLQRSTSSQAP